MTHSNLTSASAEASTVQEPPPSGGGQNNNPATPATPTTSTTNTAASGQQPGVKRKRNLPGTPDPDAEVIALSPKTLMATNRFVCEICNKGFQRDQNLQLHRRGHNLPWKLRQRTSKEIRKRVYICPEPTCVHHDPSRALGDLTGIKKHFCRKHGEKKWKCDKCSKRYAVQSDWKAHSKTCGTREYRCDCGTLFSRRDSFITHRAFCDALAEESARVSGGPKSGQGPGDHSMMAGPSSIAGGMPVMGAPQSPRNQEGQLDPMSGNTPGLSGNFAGIGIGEGGWGQAAGPGRGARLSLWSGPGPGPPQLQLGGNSQMNPMDHHGSNSPFLLMQPKSMQDFEDHISQAPSRPGGGGGGGMMQMHLPSSSAAAAAGSIFASLFASGSGHGLPTAAAGMQQSGQGGQSGGNMQQQIGNMMVSGGFSDFTGGAPPTRIDRGGLSLISSSAGMASSSSCGNSNNNNNNVAGNTVSSILNQQQQHTSTATSQMSATALLQKAAQMGATTSNSSLLRGFGMGGGQGGIWQDQGRSAAGSLPPISTGMGGGLPHPMLRRPSDGSIGMGSSLPPVSFGGGGGGGGDEHQDFMNSLSQFNAGGAMSQGLPGSSMPPTSFAGGQGRGTSSEHQEFLNSLTQFSPGGSMSSLPPMYPNSLARNNSGNVGGIMPPPTSPMQQHQHRIQGSDNLGGQQQHGNMQGASTSQAQGGMPSSLLPGINLKSEDGGDRFTRDFLGVAEQIPGRAMSQRELAGIAPPGPGGVYMSFNNQQRSVGPSGQPSPGKSWDGS